jgi:hypothetical protein
MLLDLLFFAMALLPLIPMQHLVTRRSVDLSCQMEKK